LFSSLGDAVPGRHFFDVFAGTGVVGLEALSRGAAEATFVERDFRLIDDLERHLKAFRVSDAARVVRADVYRWAERWQPPDGGAPVSLAPPSPDLETRAEDIPLRREGRRESLARGSALVLQAEPVEMLARLPRRDEWDERTYGRNVLLFWVKPE